MKTAIVHAGLACAIWGAVIVAPSLIGDVNPIAISCLRFICYGLFAMVIAMPQARSLIGRLTRRDLLLLGELALTGNVLYFMLLSGAVQFAGVAIAALINGLIPVALILMGRSFASASLLSTLASLTLIVMGIAWINLPAVKTILAGHGGTDQLLGAGLAGLGVLSWSWFALRNARHLQSGRFKPSEWSTLCGISTGVVGLAIGAVTLLIAPGPMSAGLGSSGLATVVATILFLAIGGSWIANALWNSAAQRLPVSISGLMIVFETFCALTYSFVMAKSLPTVGEVLGMTLTLGGVFIAVRAQSRASGPVMAKAA